jgi:hypothetical protein
LSFRQLLIAFLSYIIPNLLPLYFGTFQLLLIKMLFTTISLIATFAGIATALPPLTDGTHLEIGPLPYAELKAQVEAMHASNKRDGLTKRTTEGVYLCDGLNFSGNCYWGAYPIGLC